MDETRFRMDWRSAVPDWGVAIFRVCEVEGVRGLKEDETKFWKQSESDGPLTTTPPAGGEQERPRSRSPRGRPAEWLQAPPEYPPLPTTLGSQLQATPLDDALGAEGSTSQGGGSVYAAFAEQQPPWPTTYSGSVALVAGQLEARSVTPTPECLGSICDGGDTYPHK